MKLIKDAISAGERVRMSMATRVEIRVKVDAEVDDSLH